MRIHCQVGSLRLGEILGNLAAKHEHAMLVSTKELRSQWHGNSRKLCARRWGARGLLPEQVSARCQLDVRQQVGHETDRIQVEKRQAFKMLNVRCNFSQGDAVII